MTLRGGERSTHWSPGGGRATRARTQCGVTPPASDGGQVRRRRARCVAAGGRRPRALEHRSAGWPRSVSRCREDATRHRHRLPDPLVPHRRPTGTRSSRARNWSSWRGDLGYLFYLAVPADRGAFSLTMAIGATDDRPAVAVARPGRLRPGGPGAPASVRAGGPRSIPDGPVHPMGGLVNRLRRFADRRRPAARDSASMPSATPTPAPTRSTAGAVRWPWSRRWR